MTSQLTILKNDITVTRAAQVLNGKTFLEWYNTFDFQTLVDFYNSNSAISIWKPSVTTKEMAGVIDWSAYSVFAVAKQNTYLALTVSGEVDATYLNVRGGFAAVFSGATLTALNSLAKRLATNYEALFATTNGTDYSSTEFGVKITLGTFSEIINSEL